MDIRETDRAGRSAPPWEKDDMLLTLPSLLGQRAAVSTGVHRGTESGHSHLPGLQPSGAGWPVNGQRGRGRAQGAVRTHRRSCRSRLMDGKKTPEGNLS